MLKKGDHVVYSKRRSWWDRLLNKRTVDHVWQRTIVLDVDGPFIAVPGLFGTPIILDTRVHEVVPVADTFVPEAVRE